jgi:hypothetical protein
MRAAPRLRSATVPTRLDATAALAVAALSDRGTLAVEGTTTVDVQPALPGGASMTATLESLGGALTF